MVYSLHASIFNLTFKLVSPLPSFTMSNLYLRTAPAETIPRLTSNPGISTWPSSPLLMSYVNLRREVRGKRGEHIFFWGWISRLLFWNTVCCADFFNRTTQSRCLSTAHSVRERWGVRSLAVICTLFFFFFGKLRSRKYQRQDVVVWWSWCGGGVNLQVASCRRHITTNVRFRVACLDCKTMSGSPRTPKCRRGKDRKERNTISGKERNIELLGSLLPRHLHDER